MSNLINTLFKLVNDKTLLLMLHCNNIHVLNGNMMPILFLLVVFITMGTSK